MRKQKGLKRRVVLSFLCLLFLCPFLHLISEFNTKKEALELYESLNYREIETVEAPTIEPEEVEIQGEISEEIVIDPYQVPELSLDFLELQETVNEDIYAWIYIPNTNVDYPILQHPTDDSYYLKYNLDGSYGYPGAIYTESLNTMDFTDPNTVIYGHNMNDGSMFNTIKNFADAEFFEENDFIYIYTKNTTYIYEVFAAYEFSDMHLLMSYYLENEGIYESYLNSVLETRAIGANVKSEMELSKDDRIITLSTCVSSSNKRFLVQAVLVEERMVD
ncbi:MAG: class B sortase [Lachnospiraceae bacterium]